MMAPDVRETFEVKWITVMEPPAVARGRHSRSTSVVRSSSAFSEASTSMNSPESPASKPGPMALPRPAFDGTGEQHYIVVDGLGYSFDSTEGVVICALSAILERERMLTQSEIQLLKPDDRRRKQHAKGGQVTNLKVVKVGMVHGNGVVVTAFNEIRRKAQFARTGESGGVEDAPATPHRNEVVAATQPISTVTSRDFCIAFLKAMSLPAVAFS